MSDLRLVVFDMDGTLIDSQHIILAAMQRTFTNLDLPVPSAEIVRSIIGLSLIEAVKTIMPELSDAEAKEGADMYRQSFIDLRHENGGEAVAEMYPGARDALERLYKQDETLLGVATGKAKRGLDHAYKSHNIGHYFVTSQTADGHPSKPHPSMLYQALSDTGCEVSNAVMIGDTEFDIAMGKAAGFATIGVSWGYHPVERLKNAGSDHIIDHYDNLDAVLENIWRGGE